MCPRYHEYHLSIVASRNGVDGHMADDHVTQNKSEVIVTRVGVGT